VYDGLDMDCNPQCNQIYDSFFVQSVEEPIKKRYDLIISMTLLEHVKNNTSGFTQMYRALNDGGCMVHYQPSKYHPYSVLLRIIGTTWQRRLITLLRPWAQAVTGYPAYFDHCCPSTMARLAAKVGFRSSEVHTFYRGNDYFRFFLPFYLLVTIWENLAHRLLWKDLCSGFIIVSKK